MDPNKRAYNQTLVVFGAASVQALPPNPRRYAIIISPPSGNRASVVFGRTAVADTGTIFHTTTSHLELRRDIHGDIVTQSVHVVGSGVGNLGLTEIIDL